MPPTLPFFRRSLGRFIVRTLTLAAIMGASAPARNAEAADKNPLQISSPNNFSNVNNTCAPLTKVYTLDGDFNMGTLSGVITNSNQLELSPTPTTWPFAWIANASQGTLSKVDTQTGNEVARYYTGPPDGTGFHFYLSPSRTVIDKNGNCWVANRTSGDTASVTMIMIDGGDDRNLNSIIDTSTDLNANGIIGPGEILPWGQDERVKRHYLVGDMNSNGARGMVIDKMGFLWVGLTSATSLIKLDPNLPIATYAPNQPPSMPPPLVNAFTNQLPYGLALSPSGLIYMSTRSTWAFEFDPGVASGGTILGPALTDSIDHSPDLNYGIAVDKDCNVWLASCTHTRAIRWDTAANTWSVSGPGAPSVGRGITVDFNNNVWMTCSDAIGSVARYNNTPSPTMFGTYASGANGPIGAGISSDGNLIVTPSTGVWAKVNTTTGAVMPLAGPQLTGPGPYTYSDFTGSLASLSALQQGTWSVITDGLSPNFVWNLVGWTPSTPPGTAISIQARAAQTLPLLLAASWSTIGSPGPLGTPMPGRYIQTRATLQRFNEGCSTPFITPILYDLTVAGICDTCEFVSCPSDTTILCQSASGAVFEYVPPSIEEVCGGDVLINCTPPSGTVFPIGVTPVVCTAVTAGGDTAICQFNVTVLPGCNPTPTGACCLNNICQVLPEYNCLLQGGIYFGNGSNCTVGCNYACIPPPRHLGGWWKLDPGPGSTDVPNLASPSAHGTLVDNPTPLFGENVGGAYQFNGSTQYIEVAADPSLSINVGDFTFDAWVKTSAAAGIQPLLDRRGGTTTRGYSFNLVNGYPALQMVLDGDVHNFALSELNGGPGAFVADNQWHLVAVTV
ncbi:MAG: LamG-like jellyroll fold domain-containing protein, partial [Candidatus Eisenbacteria bacterium]